MMTVMFWDNLDNLVARFTVVANDDVEAIRLASVKYNATPNAEFKPLRDMATISITSL